MWPKSDLGSQAACRMLATQKGTMSDWASGRHGCGTNPHGTFDEYTKENPNALVGEFNLAWRVLTRINLDFENNGTNLNPFGDAAEGLSGSEKETLKEIMMTLSGTVIHKKNGKSFQQITLPGKGDAEAFLTALMSGGKITYYSNSRRPQLARKTQAFDNYFSQSILKIV